MTRLFIAVALLVAMVASATAQPVPNDISIRSFDPDESVAPTSSIEGPGWKVGEGTVVHPVFGVETGFVSNVFYQDNDPTPAGILRLLAQIGTASLNAQRLSPNGASDDDTDLESDKGDFEYRASLRASYDLLLTSDDRATDTGGLGLGASLQGMVNPMGRFSFGFSDDFNRLIRAANFETDANTNRDINNLSLKLLYHPRDRAVNGYLYYNNMIDIFERSEQDFADRWSHQLGLHPTWRFLPQTQAYLDVSMGYVSGLGSGSTKVTSYPLIAKAGLATLLTLKVTLNLEAGYTNGFYSSGPSFSAPVLGAGIGYRYSPLGRVSLLYALQYQDSINANYYRDHVMRLTLQQLFTPFIVMVQPEIHLRQYNGVTAVMGSPTRDDVIFTVVGGIHYNFRNWIGASLNYRFTTVQTDYSYMINGFVDDPSYVRHEVLLGVRAAL